MLAKQTAGPQHVMKESEVTDEAPVTQSVKTNIQTACPQWDETRERFQAWWAGRSLGRPLIRVCGIRSQADPKPVAADPFAFHADPAFADALMRWEMESTEYLAEAIPMTSVQLAAGSLAVYLGSEPKFRFDTVWFTEFVQSWDDLPPLTLSGENRWYRYHLDAVSKLVDLSAGDYLVGMPGVSENVDILASMRGSQELCLDMLDRPEEIIRRNAEIQAAFYAAFGEFYTRIRDTDGSMGYWAFRLWGPGRTSVLHCDFSAMIGPDEYRSIVKPYIAEQCEWLDYSVYHLDGPDAIRHVPQIMEIEALTALQWEPGAGNPDGGSPEWYDLYDRVRRAGKSLQIRVTDGTPEAIWEKCDSLVKRYGSDGLYILLPDMPVDTAREFVARADRRWG